MKSIMTVFSTMFIALPAMADYMCQAYCPTGDGMKLIAAHANHPVEAYNLVDNSCKAAYGKSTHIYVQGSNEMVQATVETACKQIDTTCK